MHQLKMGFTKVKTIYFVMTHNDNHILAAIARHAQFDAIGCDNSCRTHEHAQIKFDAFTQFVS